MQRIRITRDYRQYRKDQVVVMDNNEAFGLIDSGVAVLSKDMTSSDYKVKSDEVQADGKHTILRINKPSRR